MWKQRCANTITDSAAADDQQQPGKVAAVPTQGADSPYQDRMPQLTQRLAGVLESVACGSTANGTLSASINGKADCKLQRQ